ncbi:MAG: helix-turn-helix transcriptional regulator [Cyclobacteriaceae bacterium]|nr:helix-turn-helix transcriptional regulator [Cyclobacteriaceae bacterium]
MATHIGVDQSTYSKLERNPKNLLAEQAQKLAELYQVSLSDIISGGVSISFSNNNFSEKGYVHNLTEETPGSLIEKIISSKDSEIKTLKDENDFLRMQNKQLLDLLEKKV